LLKILFISYLGRDFWKMKEVLKYDRMTDLSLLYDEDYNKKGNKFANYNGIIKKLCESSKERHKRQNDSRHRIQ